MTDTQKTKNRLIEDLLIVRSRLDDAYNMDPQDEEWIKYLQDLQSLVYKQLSSMGVKDEEE